MNRPGEVIKSTRTDRGRSCPFVLENVSFSRARGRTLNVGTTGLRSLNDVLGKSSLSTLTYTDQKNCIKGESVAHAPTGERHLCPVRALERIVQHLAKNRASAKCPLYRYYDPVNRQTGKKMSTPKPRDVTTLMVTTLLRRAATRVQSRTGIPPQRITSRSLRPGGATSLLCAGETPTNIALVGRWRSEAILRYLS